MACGEDGAEELGELKKAGLIHPLVSLSRDLVTAWGFVVFDFAQDLLKFCDGDWVHGDRAGWVNGLGTACVGVGRGAPVAAGKVSREGLSLCKGVKNLTCFAL